MGDELLRQAAERLLPLIRMSDTLARVGGDEFILVLSRIEQRESAGIVARKIQDLFRTPFRVAGRDLFITTSIGISVFPDDGDDAESLVKNADVAMYVAKQRGRDNYQYYSRTGDRSALERLDLESNLHQAIANEGIPRAFSASGSSLRTGAITGMEALVRWKHPARESSSRRFHRARRGFRAHRRPGLLVLKLACRQTRVWRNRDTATFMSR